MQINFQFNNSLELVAGWQLLQERHNKEAIFLVQWEQCTVINFSAVNTYLLINCSIESTHIVIGVMQYTNNYTTVVKTLRMVT